jgi:hypothetical protein
VESRSCKRGGLSSLLVGLLGNIIASLAAGDGSKPHTILFVLNNRGYTVQRHLHSKERHYNDIVNWYVLVALQATLEER